jgi:PPK2 family polyphosphate:nucleotide phosphotransferase
VQNRHPPDMPDRWNRKPNLDATHLERLMGGPPSRLEAGGHVQPGCRNFSARRGCTTGFHSTSRCCGGGFAEQVAGNVKKGEAPTILRERLEIRLDENLDGLFAVINLDTNWRVAKVNLVAASVRSSNDNVGHYRLGLWIISGSASDERMNMKVRSTDLRVQEGQKVDLDKWPTAVEPIYESKKQYQKLLRDHVAQLSSLQQLLYASNRYAVLLIFQAMDAAGKDGAIRHVMSGVNPQGCQVFSYKHPSVMELQHDFLWRTTRDLPERGRIGIFNRSYYEEVLIVRVHPEILRSEGIAGGSLDEKTVWESRFRSIVGLERHLHLNGTRIVKFYLHLSKDEQRKRFLQRIDEPNKNWKFSLADIEERKFWKRYMSAFEECLSATSTREAPWYVVPADDKENARLIVSQIILDTLNGLEMTYPEVGAQRQQELQSIRERLIGGDLD